MSDQTNPPIHLMPQSPPVQQSQADDLDIIDLDIIVPVIRKVRLGGFVHYIGAPSMKTYLQVIRLRAMRNRKEVSEEEAGLDETRALIKLSVPTITEEILDTMTPAQTMRVADIIREQMEFGQPNDDPLEEKAEADPST